MLITYDANGEQINKMFKNGRVERPDGHWCRHLVMLLMNVLVKSTIVKDKPCSMISHLVL